MNGAARHPAQAAGQYALLLLIFGVGFFGYVMRTTDWMRAIPGDIFDARFNSVILEHFYQWVTGKAGSLWSPGFFYPFEGVLAFSDNHFGSAGVYALMRGAGLTREAAYQIWFITGCCLNFWVAYRVFRQLGFSIVAAGGGAFVFAFGLPALAKEAHAQLVWRFAVPLAFLAFYRALVSHRLVGFAWAAFWCAVQFYCSIYLGMFTVYLLSAMGLGFVLIERGRFLAPWRSGAGNPWFVGLAIFAVSAASVLWLLLQYQTISAHYGFTRSAREIFSMLPTPGSYLVADASALTGWIGAQVPKSEMRHELQLFAGLGAWILALIGLRLVWTDRVATSPGRIATVALFLLFALTLLIGNVSLYRAMLHVPGLSSVRAVSRIVLVMLLPFGILVACGIAWIEGKLSVSPWRWIVLLFVIVGLTAESVGYRPYSTPVQVWRDRLDRVRTLLPAEGLPHDAILFVTGHRGPDPLDAAELDGMILAQDLGVPTLNGYSGNSPPGYFKPDPCLHFRNRLDGYFAFKPRPAFSEQTLASRVRVISPEPCPVAPGLVSQEAVDAFIATHLSVSAKFGVIAYGRIYLDVSITNNTGKEFSTWSTRGPVRLSWRALPIGANGEALAQPEFAGRKELSFILGDGQTTVQPLDIDIPPPGRYRIEVTLVQDGVAWFQDLGMAVASVPVDVP